MNHFQAQEIIMHPSYPGWNSIGNDICLLKVPSLTQAAPASCNAGGTNSCFASACLPTENFRHGEACWASGWGATSWGGDFPTFLQSVGVNLFSEEYCIEHSTDEAKEGIMHEVEICAGTPDKDNNGLIDAGKDACSGDSGGPLTCVRDGQPVLVGLVSWGLECANEGEPGIYTNVFPFVDWIEEVIAESTDPWTTTSTSTPTMTSTSNSPGPEPEFAETTDQIPSGLQCTTGFPNTSENAKIIGGVITEKGTYPWQVRLFLNGMYQCGGAIIDDRWVLTAAHCCDSISSIEIFVGDWNQWSNDDNEFSIFGNGSI